MKKDAPFRGILFLAAGDFRQVAPVTKGCVSSIMTQLACMKMSQLWHHFQTISLTYPFCGEQDLEYVTFIDCVGEDYAHSTVNLNLLRTITSVEDTIDFLYPSDILLQPLKCLYRALLSWKNCFINNFNSKMLQHRNELRA
jgi:hypothetical protein